MAPDPVSQSSTPPSPAVSDVAAATAQPARFCGRCGDRLEATPTDLHACRPAGAPADVAGRPDNPLGAALGLYFVFLATLIVSVVGDGVEYQMATQVIDAVIVLTFCAFQLRTVQPLLQLPRWWWWPGSVALGVGTFALADVFVRLLQAALPIPELRMTDDFFAGGHGLATIVLFICLQPAVIEELAFRGVILGALARFLSRREAIIVSALMFMIIHLTFFGFPQLMIGLVLGWMRFRTGSLWPCIALHFTHNFLCVAEEVWWT